MSDGFIVQWPLTADSKEQMEVQRQNQLAASLLLVALGLLAIIFGFDGFTGQGVVGRLVGVVGWPA